MDCPSTCTHAMIVVLRWTCYLSSRAVHSRNCTPAEFTPGHSELLRPAWLEIRKVRVTVQDTYCLYHLSWRLEAGEPEGSRVCACSVQYHRLKYKCFVIAQSEEYARVITERRLPRRMLFDWWMPALQSCCMHYCLPERRIDSAFKQKYPSAQAHSRSNTPNRNLLTLRSPLIV
jgi:hypothetical protein